MSRCIIAWLLSLTATAAFAQNPFTLSEADEIALGRASAAEVEKEVRVLDAPGITKYISALGRKLVEKSGRPGLEYSFKVVDSPEVNAFALPGGFIYVNRGLIETADSEDELAGVLGHEIAHVVARHGAEQAMRAGLVQAGIGALGGLLGQRGGTGASMTKMAAQMVATGVFLKFSRDAERQADQLGARMLLDANIRPQGMVSFFEKLSAMQRTQPNAVLKFFSSHPSPDERARNVSTLVASRAVESSGVNSPEFESVRKKLAAMPRPELEAARVAAAREAAAVVITDPPADVRARNIARDRDIAKRFAPVFHQAIGPAPRFDFITNFDFDGDWIGDNNWNNAENRSFPLKAYVYYAVFETRTHFFIHYAAFHPRDYKGGEKRGALLSEAIRLGVQLGGQYDPTGRSREAVLAHENDLEGALVIAEKNGPDPSKARLSMVESLAHNVYLKYPAAETSPVDGLRPQLYVEPMGHGIEAWKPDDALQRQKALNGFVPYEYRGRAEDPDNVRSGPVGYDLLPLLETFWPRARAGNQEMFADEYDYGITTIRVDASGQDVERVVKIGKMGSALNGKVGAANMSRPPWGWFEGEDRGRPLGEWFLQPAESVKRRWNLPDTFSTTYLYNPFLGVYR